MHYGENLYHEACKGGWFDDLIFLNELRLWECAFLHDTRPHLMTWKSSVFFFSKVCGWWGALFLFLKQNYGLERPSQMQWCCWVMVAWHHFVPLSKSGPQKLTAKALRMDGWKTSFPFGEAFFQELLLLVLGGGYPWQTARFFCQKNLH